MNSIGLRDFPILNYVAVRGEQLVVHERQHQVLDTFFGDDLPQIEITRGTARDGRRHRLRIAASAMEVG